MILAFRALTGILLALPALYMPGCSEINYDKTPQGKLGGKLILEWIDQDKFRFISDPEKPLQFVRANNEVIKPGPMFTDGGSIPGPLRAIKSFSPWGYAPAFIIHDWLFVMKQCKLAGYEKWDHLKAAEVFSEVMKTVMENPKFGGPNKLVHYSMYEAVRSSVAQKYWDEGKCETPTGTPRYLPQAIAKAQDALESTIGRTRSLSPAPALPNATNIPARIRTVIEY
ncbi:MAG: DUF1353 domain-containing protein [Alphaproteobacteria bacterium]|nr:DUF1353 domain-containing protein [Alphaproteobacteria bacterium]